LIGPHRFDRLARRHELDMTARTLSLSNGDQMPAVGLGMWKIDRSQAPQVIEQAARCGYRHFDSACDYGNEPEVGAGIRRVLDARLCSREELWITSKLWNTYHQQHHVRPAVERTLKDLGVDYLDLYLIHFPIALRYVALDKRYPPGWFYAPDTPAPCMEPVRVPIHETWRAMETLVDAGLVRNIGVCNFGCSLLRDLLSYAMVRPTVLQIESHPYLTQEVLLRYCREEEIVITAFSPLGALSYIPLGMADRADSVLDEPAIRHIARQHARTPAQVVLRWAVQRGTAVIPKTTNPEHLDENLAMFDFTLTPDEMETIRKLNRNCRFNDPGVFCEDAFNTFCPIFE